MIFRATSNVIRVVTHKAMRPDLKDIVGQPGWILTYHCLELNPISMAIIPLHQQGNTRVLHKVVKTLI